MQSELIATEGTRATSAHLVLHPDTATVQPPLHAATRQLPPLGAVIASLAVGGAERIVLDWAQRAAQRQPVWLCVLHDQPHEWPLPAKVRVVRLRSLNLEEGIARFSRQLSSQWDARELGRPSVLCHLTLQKHRDALARGGAAPVTVLHNAQEGWREPSSSIDASSRVVAISRACLTDLARCGRTHNVSLIRHLPRALTLAPAAIAALRQRLCATLDLPCSSTAKLVAMSGGVKPQKNYLFALEVFHELSLSVDAYLVIFGGPVGPHGVAEWQSVRRRVLDLGLQDRVRLPGFVPNAAAYFPAFSSIMNTSLYEGLSMATLEALIAHRPVVATRVGGQGEVGAPGLQLLPSGAPASTWVRALREAFDRQPEAPSWAGFPAARLWTLEHLASQRARRAHVVFATANLNAGGAQRSLVNLTTRLASRLSLEVVVTGISTTTHFQDELRSAGVAVARSAEGKHCFDHAEGLLTVVARTGCSVLCCWNLDPKLKLLLAKVLPADVQLIDVSPGGYAFEEMQATQEFQQLIGFTEQELYGRMRHLVLKYDGPVPPHVTTPVTIIRNGVPSPATQPAPYAPDPRVIINGRIAPSKFLVEVAEAMGQVWRQHPRIELHVLGLAEPRHQAYGERFCEATREAVEANPGCGGAHFHGHRFSLEGVARPGDIAVVLGHHQGCPNAVLEAMMSCMAVVANDSGGTAEIVREGTTGVLLLATDAQGVAQALTALIANPATRLLLADAGRAFVEKQFSMSVMVEEYARLITPLLQTTPERA